ncbi:MAG TPA: Fe-Mn family superoxide dismutase [Methylomirabilota bacterium]|nr:Fe-Mn family superoxide dismutase [Methylomirabilota bacterium]
MNDQTSYPVQQHLKPGRLTGISDAQIEQHWALYEGYVKNTNSLFEALGRLEIGSREWAELKRRAGFEFNGMVLHEYYFGNLAAGSHLSPSSDLAVALTAMWGTVNVWREDLAKTAAMRGVGWAILYHDPAADRLFNWWVSDHEVNHPAGLHPILVVDVFEHAWVVDYGIAGREAYIAAFFENVHWEVVEQRFRTSTAGHLTACA